MAPDRLYTTELSRELGLYHLTMRGLGVMIGAGVFFGIGTSIAAAGPGGLLLTFAFNGILALLTALSYAELSSAVPEAGGAYDFARMAFGRRIGFMAGWMEWLAASVAAAMYATTLALYAVHFAGSLGLLRLLPSGTVIPLERILAAGVALALIAVHWIGAEGTGRLGARIVLAEMLFLGLIGAIGIAAAFREPSRLAAFRPFLPFGPSPLPVAMGLTFVAFEGFEVIAQAGEETRSPRKNLPRAMLYAVLAGTVAYLAVAFASVVGAGPAGGRDPAWHWVASYGATGFGEVASRLLPGGWLLPSLAVVLACLLALNATLTSAARSAYALGRDRMLPSLLSRLSPRGGTPFGALLLTGVLVVPAALLVPLIDLAAGASLMFLLVFSVVNLSTIRARLERGHELHYSFRTPAFPAPQILALIGAITLGLALARVSRFAWLLPQVWVLAGVAVYMVYSRKRALPAPDEGLVLEETGEAIPSGHGNDLMIAISNPKNALSLVGSAVRLCGEEQCVMQLLHMVPAPAPVSLSDARAYMKEGKEGLVEAMLYLYSRYPVTTTVRYCRNIARGIVSAVHERKVRTLILGWHGATSRDLRFHIGSTLDPVLTRAQCDVVVLKDCGDRLFRNILVAIFGSPSDVLALRTAVLMAEKQGGRIKALLPQSWGSSRKIRQKFDQLLLRTDLQTVEVRVQTASVSDMTRAVIRRAPRYDLVVLGVREPLLPTFGSLAVPETIARRCRRPLVIVKAHRRLGAWTRWWL